MARRMKKTNRLRIKRMVGESPPSVPPADLPVRLPEMPSVTLADDVPASVFLEGMPSVELPALAGKRVVKEIAEETAQEGLLKRLLGGKPTQAKFIKGGLGALTLGMVLAHLASRKGRVEGLQKELAGEYPISAEAQMVGYDRTNALQALAAMQQNNPEAFDRLKWLLSGQEPLKLTPSETAFGRVPSNDNVTPEMMTAALGYMTQNEQ